MDLQRRWSDPGLVGLFLLSIILSGCTSADLITRKDREIAVLRDEKSRLRESLSQAILKIDRLRDEVTKGTRQKETVVEETAELRSQLRFANEQVEAAARERGKLETKFKDAEAKADRLERSLAKVKDVASDSASELADLRLKSQSNEQELGQLRSENESLRAERTGLLTRVSAQEEELTKMKAVVRSLRTEDQDTRITELEKQNADLRGEMVALELRYENLAAREEELSKVVAIQSRATNDAAGLAGSTLIDELVYVSNPVGLFDEVSGFLTVRYRKALTGEIAWDAFDKLAVSAAAILLALVVGFVFRTRQILRLKREVQDLREELYEDEGEVDDAEDLAEPEPAPREVSPFAGVRRRPAKPTLRRGGFSAVISEGGGEPETPVSPAVPPPSFSAEPMAIATPDVDVTEDMGPPMSIEPGDRSSEEPAAFAAPESAASVSADADEDGRGAARTWVDEESAAYDEDSLDRTQLIQLSPEELGAAKLVTVGEKKPDESAAESDDKKENGSGEDLLGQLRSALNDKLGEL